MGSAQNNKIYIIWIDQYIDGEEIKKYKAELEQYKEIKVECFKEVNKGINCLKDKEKNYKKTIVITSGKLFPPFYQTLQKCIKELTVVPKIIIYTSNAQKYRDENAKYPKPSPLDDPIYNIGGVVDNKNDLKKFIEISINTFSGNYYETIKNEEFKFQFISDINELILPMYYPDHIKVTTEGKIEEFVEYLTKEFKNITPINNLFSQLPISNEIEKNLLIHFWLRAYSTHLMTLKNPEGYINLSLNEKNLYHHLPMMRLLYKNVKDGLLASEAKNTLYKGITIHSETWEKIYKKYQEQNNGDISKAIIYGDTFFSFYRDINTVNKFKNYNKKGFGRFDIYLNLILEGTTNFRFVKNNTIITKEVSYFDDKYNDEVLFFPFSCFEIVKIEEKKKIDPKDPIEFTLTLNYLDKYIHYFEDDASKSLKNVIQNEYSELVMNSDLIETDSNDLPDWFTKFLVIKKIDDESLLNSVSQICQAIINKMNFNFEDDLRVKIENDLKEKYNGDWWISIKNQKIKKFGSINEDSIMIFKCSLKSGIIYIHVAQLDDE